ncbi:C4-dicarboxylate transporter, DctM subunit [Anaerovirgula multivorans]|uniref:C4-dicarboxylate transporter, DctM subunit n=1 Tax=Anaerovirgula multivorans TaxID=312168 RepID=A0A239GXR5_9FIRM|nr:TRAP transporter large permease [Anaerovirgula multivorans]SNS73721.1 C4-dicarboxylate transporter, DctM subunit [Anaerovirgula multivorans]
MGTAETVLIVTLFIAMLAGVPITWSLGLASTLSIVVNIRLPITVISQRLFTGSDSFSMLAIPAFILAGDIMSKGGLSKRLVDFANSLVGWIAGGVSLVSLVACTFFAAISGSSVATTAAIGGLMYPEMVKRGYPKDYSSAIQAIGGTLGIVIPPSIVLVIYGNITGVSVADLLMAGIIPGIICGIVLCIMAYFIAKKQNFPKEEKFVPKKLASTFKEAIWALIMPVIILGGIYSGVFTPTESAAIAVFYGIIVCVFIYKELTFKDLWPIMKETAKSSANLMMLVVTAQLFGWLITYYRIPVYVTDGFMAVASGPYMFLILVNILLIIAGMFMEVGATNLILAPILAPIAVAFGVDPVQFGMVFVFLLAMGQATPPFGTTMFVASGISKEPVSRVARQILPFTAVQIGCALLFSFVPILSTWLPSLVNR